MANLSLSYYKNQKPVTTMTSSVLQKGTAVEQRLSKRTDPDLLESKTRLFPDPLDNETPCDYQQRTNLSWMEVHRPDT